MALKLGEIIRERLGWCPGAGTIRSGSSAMPGTCFSFRNTSRIPGTAGGTGDGGASPVRAYEHTQAGILQIIAVLAVIVIIVITTFLFGPQIVPLAVLLLLVIIVLSFATLTVTIGNDAVRIRFGPLGLVRKNWRLSEIVSATPVTSPWYYGYGIRWTPHGPLYNVAGSGAVEILLVSGKKVRIGTDEPEQLAGAISRAIR
jgi:hypothetical protein